MRITRIGRDSEQGPQEWFTGSVWMEKVAEPSDVSSVAVSRVHFAPGARTAWHFHPAGQVLHVTDGVGLVQQRGGELQEIRAGDTVWTDAGEWHWHGATPHTFMTHLAVYEAVDGTSAEWGQQVTSGVSCLTAPGSPSVRILAGQRALLRVDGSVVP